MRYLFHISAFLLLVCIALSFLLAYRVALGVEGIIVGTTIVQTASASNSLAKAATSTCPTDFTLIGGGVKMTLPLNPLIQVSESYPDATANAWVATLNESAAVASNWQFNVYAVCAKFR